MPLQVFIKVLAWRFSEFCLKTFGEVRVIGKAYHVQMCIRDSNEDTYSDHRFLVLVNHLSGDFLASLLGEGRNDAS